MHYVKDLNGFRYFSDNCAQKNMQNSLWCIEGCAKNWWLMLSEFKLNIIWYNAPAAHVEAHLSLIISYHAAAVVLLVVVAVVGADAASGQARQGHGQNVNGFPPPDDDDHSKLQLVLGREKH